MNTENPSGDLIFYEQDQFENLQRFLAESDYSSFFILMDQNTENYCKQLIFSFFPNKKTHHYTVPEGESSKDIKIAQAIWSKMTQLKLDRKALMVNLGGGVISDLGGFTASLYKRGIDFIHLPSSLLGMVDAAIGGKCGIDFQFYKNQIGLFNFAKGIFIYPGFLKTLPEKEIKSGLVELIKHALIADQLLFQQIKDDLNRGVLWNDKVIRKAAKIKSQMVQFDPLDQGDRKKLNFGHSIGHAIETYFYEKNQSIPHGYAVGMGIICESFISTQINGFSKSDLIQIVDLFKTHFQWPKLPKDAFPEILHLLKNDKKRMKDEHRFILLKEIGKAEIDQPASDVNIVESLAYYNQIR